MRLAILFLTLAFATKPTPPTPEQIERMRREFVQGYSYRPEGGGYVIEQVLRQHPEGHTVNDKPIIGEDLLEQVLATYPVEELARYLGKTPFEIDASGFRRGLLHIQRRGYDGTKLVSLAKAYLLLGKNYYRPGRPEHETQSLIAMAKHFFPSCEPAGTVKFFERFFCVEEGTSKETKARIGNQPDKLYLVNGPARMELTADQTRFLSDDCRARVPTQFACPTERLPEETIGSSETRRASRAANEAFRCHGDEDCVAIKNGCGLASVVGNSPNVHRRFRCVCHQGPTVYGCFREGK